MISLTRLSRKVFTLNADLIERIDSVPDTVITLVDGTKYVVSEAVIEVIDEVIAYQRKIRVEQAADLDRPGSHTGAPARPLEGLTQTVFADGGQPDLPDLTDELSFEVDDRFALVDDAATMLLPLEVEGRQAFPTETGREWYTADIDTSKQLFVNLAVEQDPVIKTIVEALENSDNGTLGDEFFRDLLRRGSAAEVTEKQLDRAVDWGRYAKLFDYDADTRELVLTEVAAALLPDLT